MLTGQLHCRETALRHLSELRHAPSVGLQDVPSESVGEHLGFSSREIQTDDLDEKLARKFRNRAACYIGTELRIRTYAVHEFFA